MVRSCYIILNKYHKRRTGFAAEFILLNNNLLLNSTSSETTLHLLDRRNRSPFLWMSTRFDRSKYPTLSTGTSSIQFGPPPDTHLSKWNHGELNHHYQYSHQKRSWSARPGRCSIALKHSSAGMAYPNSNLQQSEIGQQMSRAQPSSRNIDDHTQIARHPQSPAQISCKKGGLGRDGMEGGGGAPTWGISSGARSTSLNQRGIHDGRRRRRASGRRLPEFSISWTCKTITKVPCWWLTGDELLTCKVADNATRTGWWLAQRLRHRRNLFFAGFGFRTHDDDRWLVDQRRVFVNILKGRKLN